jgi:hypothetical protein
MECKGIKIKRENKWMPGPSGRWVQSADSSVRDCLRVASHATELLNGEGEGKVWLGFGNGFGLIYFYILE